MLRETKNAPARILTEWNPVETRPKERPKSKWKEQVENDLRKLQVINWKRAMEDRRKWRNIITKAKAHIDL